MEIVTSWKFNKALTLTQFQRDVFSSLNVLLQRGDMNITFFDFMEYTRMTPYNIFLFDVMSIHTNEENMIKFREDNIVSSFILTIDKQPEHILNKTQKDFIRTYASFYMAIVLLSPNTRSFHFNVDYSITHSSLGTFHLSEGDIKGIQSFLYGYRSTLVTHLEQKPKELIKLIIIIITFLEHQESIYVGYRSSYKENLIRTTLSEGIAINNLLTRKIKSRVLFLSYINGGDNVVSEFSSRFKPTYCIFLQPKNKSTSQTGRSFPLFLWDDFIEDIPDIKFAEAVKYKKLSLFTDRLYSIFSRDEHLRKMFLKSHTPRTFLLQYLSVKTNNCKEIWEHMKWLRCPSIINNLDIFLKDKGITGCIDEDITFLTTFLFDPYLYYSP